MCAQCKYWITKDITELNYLRSIKPFCNLHIPLYTFIIFRDEVDYYFKHVRVRIHIVSYDGYRPISLGKPEFSSRNKTITFCLFFKVYLYSGRARARFLLLSPSVPSFSSRSLHLASRIAGKN